MKSDGLKIKYLTFGSPLMDIIVDVESDFISRNSLKLDTTNHVDSTSDPVFRELKSYKPHYIAGGCSYNAIRVLNWILSDTEEKGLVACLGSIGDDLEGKKYKSLLEKENIASIFETYKGKITGKCAVICNLRNRVHLTDLGASTLISDEFVTENWSTIKDVSLVYTELYILSSRASTVFKLAELCLDDKKTFGFNLPAEFFLNKFSEKILEVITYGDVIFANLEEAKFMVTEVLKQEYSDISDLAIILAKLPKKNTKKKRVMIVTCGPDTAYVVIYDHLKDKVEYINNFEPLLVDKNDIVDTNGAGDSFAGGFLAYYITGKPIEDCMLAGHYAAAAIIQKRGVDIPTDETPDIYGYKKKFITKKGSSSSLDIRDKNYSYSKSDLDLIS